MRDLIFSGKGEGKSSHRVENPGLILFSLFSLRPQVLGHSVLNRPFPSSCLPPLQSESKCEVFVMVISSTLHMNDNEFS